MKRLKEFLKAHGLETETETDYEEIIEVLYVPNSHGAFERDGSRYNAYEFCVFKNKVLVRKRNIGTFQCRFVPWKGEHPEEMYFNFEYIG